MAGAALNRHNSNPVVGTPRDFLDAVESVFGPLEWDLAATAENAKAPRFFTEADDSLSQAWPTGALCWLNPPYDNIAPWAAKCAHEAKLGARILFLVPASVGANWFAEHVFGHSMVLFLSPRLVFDGHTQPYPKDLILAGYGFDALGFEYWQWREKKPRRRKV
jgi:phage N-6-adenine-methyltransferase